MMPRFPQNFPAELNAWAPPQDITVSQWAEAYRVLPKQSAIPGPWKNHLVPYAIGVMDAFCDRRVEQITIMASVQSAKTESAYNMLAYTICQDPAPALVIMPTQKTLKKVNRRLRQMLYASPELQRHVSPDPDDLRYEVFILDRMEIYFGTAGSEADLQFVEARLIILDEVDLYPPGAVKMAIDRATTYWDRKIIKLSRPTVANGHINQEYMRSDRRAYWVPCPHCGGFQVLDFWQIKHHGADLGSWPADKRDPEYIKTARAARYECRHCQAELDDRDKPAMLAAGKWVPAEHDFDQATGEMAPLPAVSHVGFWWSMLYSPFKNFSEIAAEFFDTRQDREKLKNFKTQWLAEPWKEVIQTRAPAALLQLRTDRPPLVVPRGVVALTAGLDNQQRGFWCVIRAWLLEPPSSHLVRYGYLESFEEVERWLFQDVYTSEDGIAYPVWRAGIDTGGGAGAAGEATMTEQVYAWLRAKGQGRVFGVKGVSRSLAGGKKLQLSIIDRMPSGKPLPGGIRLWLLDTGLFKDAIWSRIETGQFFLHNQAGEDYARQLSSEAKEMDARGRAAWVVQGNQPNHLLDCEVYAAAMADTECWGGLLVLPRRSAAPPEEPPLAGPGWVGHRPGWFKR